MCVCNTVYVHVCVGVSICTHTLICVWTYGHVCMCNCTNVRVNVCMCVYTYVCTSVYVNLCLFINVSMRFVSATGAGKVAPAAVNAGTHTHVSLLQSIKDAVKSLP